jgi:hypothetical protein
MYLMNVRADAAIYAWKYHCKLIKHPHPFSHPSSPTSWWFSLILRLQDMSHPCIDIALILMLFRTISWESRWIGWSTFIHSDSSEWLHAEGVSGLNPWMRGCLPWLMWTGVPANRLGLHVHPISESSTVTVEVNSPYRATIINCAIWTYMWLRKVYI